LIHNATQNKTDRCGEKPEGGNTKALKAETQKQETHFYSRNTYSSD
jgi:hypothetical protein